MAENVTIKKLGKTPLDPISVGRQYYSELRVYVKEIKDLIELYLVPEVSTLLTNAGYNRPSTDSQKSRQDGYGQDIEEIIDQIRDLFGTQYTEVEIAAMASKYATLTELFNQKQFEKSLGGSPDFGLSLARSTAFVSDELQAFTLENIKLIKSIEAKYLEDVQGIVTRGVQRGGLVKDIQKDIRSRYGVTKNRAKLIARDQTAKFNSTLTRLKQESVGVQLYQWSTSLDGRVRDSHSANEGRVFSWNNPPSTGHPGEDVACRCVAIPILEFEE